MNTSTRRTTTSPRPTLPSPQGSLPPWVPVWDKGGTGPFAPDGNRGGAIPPELYHVAAAGPELVKRLYSDPEYKQVIDELGRMLARIFEDDPDAFEAFKALLERHGASLEDRIVITAGVAAAIIGASFVGGAVLGYFAEKGKDESKK